MTQTQIIEALAIILEVDVATILPTSELRSFRLWDSTAGINVLVVFDEHGVVVEEDKIRSCETVQDLVDLTAAGRARTSRDLVEPVQEDCL